MTQQQIAEAMDHTSQLLHGAAKLLTKSRAERKTYEFIRGISFIDNDHTSFKLRQTASSRRFTRRVTVDIAPLTDDMTYELALSKGPRWRKDSGGLRSVVQNELLKFAPTGVTELGRYTLHAFTKPQGETPEGFNPIISHENGILVDEETVALLHGVFPSSEPMSHEQTHDMLARIMRLEATDVIR